jgi:hypothetical protein
MLDPAMWQQFLQGGDSTAIASMLAGKADPSQLMAQMAGGGMGAAGGMPGMPPGMSPPGAGGMANMLTPQAPQQMAPMPPPQDVSQMPVAPVDLMANPSQVQGSIYTGNFQPGQGTPQGPVPGAQVSPTGDPKKPGSLTPEQMMALAKMMPGQENQGPYPSAPGMPGPSQVQMGRSPMYDILQPRRAIQGR